MTIVCPCCSKAMVSSSDGEEVLDVIEALDTPVIAVLHAVPAVGPEHRRAVLQRVIDAAAAVVVLSRTDAVTLSRATASRPTGST